MKELTDKDIDSAEYVMQRAQESYTAEIERNMRQLVRPDGQPVFGPAEMQEREKAIRETAASTRDPVLSRYQAQAEEAIAEAEREIAMLTGTDRLATLAPDDAARADVRRAFVQEDAQLPAHQLGARVSAVVAAADVVEALLFDRYMRRRLDGDLTPNEREAINTLVERLSPLTVDPKAREKRDAAEALKERGRKLRKATWDTTREENVDRLMREMQATGAYNVL